MKRLALLAVLLSVVSFSNADTIKLTSGSGTIYPPFVAPGYIFQFNGSGYSISIPGALDDFGGSLVNCNPCDQIPSSGFPLFLASGGILVTGDPYLTGAFEFDAVSFVSSVAPSGVVTVRYTATASFQLFLLDATTDLPVAGPFVWGSPEPWLITAQFTPYVGTPTYQFTGATLISTPEPTTIVLLGTGILLILFGVRKRRPRCASGNPTDR